MKFLVLSNPMGLELTLTNGVVSYVNRIINNQTWIQYTAPSSPGSSGGPVFNINGEVIGVVTLKIVYEGVEGINFAIPINDAKLLLEKEKSALLSDLFNLQTDPWDLSDEKILEAIKLGESYYNDASKLIDKFSIYTISYSLLYCKTNVTITTPYFWVAFEAAQNKKVGKKTTLEDGREIVRKFNKLLGFMILIYGNNIDFMEYYSVVLYVNDKKLSPVYSDIDDSPSKTIYYPKSPKYYAFNFYTFDNTEIPRNSTVKLLIYDGFGKQEVITIDLSKFP